MSVIIKSKSIRPDNRTELLNVRDSYDFMGIKLFNPYINQCIFKSNSQNIYYQYQYLKNARTDYEKLHPEFERILVNRKRTKNWELHVLLGDIEYPKDNFIVDVILEKDSLIWGDICSIVYDIWEDYSDSIDNSLYGLFGFYKLGNIIYPKICSIF